MSLRRCIAATLLLASHTAAVAEHATEAFAEAVVELLINGQPASPALIVRRDTDGTVLLRAADLPDLRLRAPVHGALMVNGERYYRMGAENGVVAIFDEVSQSVQLTLPAQAFLPTHALRTETDAVEVHRPAPGAFVNYDVAVEEAASSRQAGGFFELGGFGPLGVATATLVARSDDTDAGALVRLDTTWTRDFPDRIATLRVGDAISTPGAWGRAVRFGGMQFGTNFSTRPTLVTTPLLAAEGEAVVPSTVDVFVNGRQVASEAVPPGPFSIDHLPAITGAGQLQVVVTDALGREQVIVQPYYSSTVLLRGGLSEYSVEVGSTREDYGTHSFAYGDLLGAATYRRGLTDTLTGGVHMEAQARGSLALGGDAAWQAGQVGILTAQLAVGGDPAETGWLAGVGMEHNGPRLSAYVQTLYTSPTFGMLGDRVLKYTPRQRTFAGVGLDFGGRGNLQFAYGLQSYHEAASVETLGLGYALSLQRLGYVSLFGSHTRSESAGSSVLLTWTLPLGERRSVSSALQYSPPTGHAGGFDATSTVQQNLPSGSGTGYSASISTADEQRLNVAYQGRAGVASLDYARRGDSSGIRAGAVGGLAITQAGVMPARQLTQSFAVVQVADYPGLTVFVDNQPIGRTDAKGRVLVDALRPYERNEISVDPAQVPMDGSLDQAAIGVTPAYRSGALVRFPVSRAFAATLRLVRMDGSAVPAGASAELGGAAYPVVLDGLLYVEGLEGEARVPVTWHGGRCEANLQRPGGTDPMPDLGTVQCR